MARSHDAVVEAQFGRQAAAYVASALHAGGEDLDAIGSLAERARPGRALDLGSGGGHVAYRLAAHARSVTAVDLSAAMLDAVRETARQRGLSNIETLIASAEDLPFDDASFDFLVSRFSVHHWSDWTQGLREARRVLTPGAPAIFIDVISPGHAPFDTHLQAIELLRDPSHVRNRSEGEWATALAHAGFRVRATVKRRLRMDYRSWVDRMKTPDVHREAIRSLQHSASAGTARYFEIEPDGSFSVDVVQIEAGACRARAL